MVLNNISIIGFTTQLFVQIMSKDNKKLVVDAGTRYNGGKKGKSKIKMKISKPHIKNQKCDCFGVL